MKVTSLLAPVALLAVAASFAGLALNAAALALFASAAVCLVLMIATADYRRQPRSLHDVPVTSSRRAALPLAA